MQLSYKRDLAKRIELIYWVLVLENMNNYDIAICDAICDSIESRMSDVLVI
jgi:hypothetical protein